MTESQYRTKVDQKDAGQKEGYAKTAHYQIMKPASITSYTKSFDRYNLLIQANPRIVQLT